MSPVLRRRLWDLGVPLLVLAGGSIEIGTEACRSCAEPAEHFHHLGSRESNAAFLAAMCLPLMLRRRYPFAVFTALLITQAIWHVTMYWQVDWTVGSGAPPDAPFIAGAVAAFALGRHARVEARDVVALLILSWVGTQIALSGAQRDGTVGGGGGWELFCLVALVLGRVLGRREREIEWLRERAALLERERELEAARAALQERTRIARELHDVIAHSVSVMVVQAGAERRVLAPGQSSVHDTLRAIEESGREALTELRRLLGVLRADGAGDSLRPQPGLAGLDALLEESRSAGQDVRLTLEGEPDPLPAGVDLAAYRIIQEALTNSRKHAPGSPVEVTVRWRREDVRIEVCNAATATEPPGAGTGHGLLGLRERAALYGGTVEAGPAGPDGGFRVTVTLPLRDAGA